MGISSISVGAIERISTQAEGASAQGSGSAAATARANNPLSLVQLDEITNLPLPPRFPWLSRLTAELEPTAKQKPPFPSTPPLGENLDRAV